MIRESSRLIVRAAVLESPPGWCAVFGFEVDIEWIKTIHHSGRRIAVFDETATKATRIRLGMIGDIYSYPADGSTVQPPFAPVAVIVSLDPRWGRMFEMLSRWGASVISGGMIAIPNLDAASDAMVSYWRLADPSGSQLTWDDAVDHVGDVLVLRRKE